MAIKATIEAASRARRRTSPQIFPGPTRSLIKNKWTSDKNTNIKVQIKSTKNSAQVYVQLL